MDDLVKRLRNAREGYVGLHKEAAKEIERLRTALERIRADDEQASHPCGPQQYGYFGDIANKALSH